jgi:hypothetical protein
MYAIHFTDLHALLQDYLCTIFAFYGNPSG